MPPTLGQGIKAMLLMNIVMDGGDGNATVWMFSMPLHWTLKKLLRWQILYYVYFTSKNKKNKSCDYDTTITEH